MIQFVILSILSLIAPSFGQSQNQQYYTSSSGLSLNKFNLTFNEAQLGHLPDKVTHVFKKITIQVLRQSPNIIDIQFLPEANEDFFSFPKEPPYTDLYDETNTTDPVSELDEFSFEFENNGLRIIRNSTGEIIFDTTQFTFLLSKYYMDIATILPTSDLFGLGERNHPHLRYPPGVYTLYGSDHPSFLENGKGGPNVHSSHPVYLMREKSNNYHVVFLKNSAGITANLTQSSLRIRAVGGIPHFKIFLGDKTPESAVKMYHKYLGGGFSIPPFWSLGYHQSRWKYISSEQLLNVVINHHVNDLPLDTIWSDIDYFSGWKNLELNSARYKESDFHQIRSMNVNFVGIIDSAVELDYVLKNQVVYDAFCRSPTTGEYFLGKQWVQKGVFIDPFNPKALNFLENQIQNLNRTVHYSGIWIDMNEPANLDNLQSPLQMTQADSLHLSTIGLGRKPEYLNENIPLAVQIGTYDINWKTLPNHLKHYGNYLHKDVHNLYGMQLQYLIRTVMKKVTAQPFVLSRSSFAGSGKFGAKWTGDNTSNFLFLQISLPQIVLFNIFGIPMIGADICGFQGNTDEHLCARWIQLGSLYPFARNHNSDLGTPQELYQFFSNPLFKEGAKNNLHFRYSMLKHMYSLFIASNRVGMIWKPLFFEFPDCTECFSDSILDSQFMLGDSLLLAPVLTRNVDSVTLLLPSGNWYDFITGLRFEGTSARNVTVINSIKSLIPSFLREGKGIMRQNTKFIKTTKDLSNTFYFITALEENEKDSKWQSIGTILDLTREQYFDESYIENTCMETSNSTSRSCTSPIRVEFSLTDQDLLSFHLLTPTRITSPDLALSEIHVYGFPASFKNKLGKCNNLSVSTISVQKHFLKIIFKDLLYLAQHRNEVDFCM